MALIDTQTKPIKSLLIFFASWKTFLLSIALGASIVPDYDTSTSLFFHQVYSPSTAASAPALARTLTRWDALYFIHPVRVGSKVYEQEWAFSSALSNLIAGFQPLLRITGINVNDVVVEPLVGIAVSHVAHLISAIALYRLTHLLSQDKRLAFVASALHVITPGGLFLSSPYAESSYACLSFVANYLFALSYHCGGSVMRDIRLVGAGLVFGLATWFRSNGLASGLLFAVEAARSLYLFLKKPSLLSFLKIAAPILGGLLLGAGVVVPQIFAWMLYCRPENGLASRPWCANTIPSIYSFVQDYYWDVGFLRYWTLNQLPLFLLATPVLTILITSGIRLVRDPSSVASQSNLQLSTLVCALAASQVFVAVLAILSYHVQIINRISSGYAPWYWWIAQCLIDKQSQKFGWSVVVFMVMYAGIQGSLYASFLPPA